MQLAKLEFRLMTTKAILVHTLRRTKRERERERGAENKKSCPEVICYIV